MSIMTKKMNKDELCSLLESVSKIEYLEQTEQDELVEELIDRWISQ